MSIEIKPWQIWSLTGLVIIVSRIFFTSSGLWHNDAADFIRVAQQWLLTKQYVPAHAPDYPTWNLLLTVWLWIKIKFFLHWPIILWANYLNLFLGSLTCILTGYFFWLREKNHWLASFASLLLAFNPLYWLHQQTSLSDVPAILFTVCLLIFLQKNISQTNWKNYLFIVISVFALLTTRLASGLTLLPILLWLALEQYQQPKKLFFNHGSIIFGAGLAIALYLAINHNLNDLLMVSRRVNPSWLELYNTITSWLNANNLIFILLAITGLFKIFYQKNKLGWLIISSLIIWLFYVSGWWREGSFDVTRYSLPTTIFISLAGAYSLKTITSKKHLFIIFYCLIGLTLVSIIFNQSSEKQIYIINQKSYQQIYNLHNATDPKQKLYITVAPKLPDNAKIFIPSYDWSYPKLFLLYQNINQRQIIFFDPDDTKKIIEQMYEETKNNQNIYILERLIADKKLAEELESDNWQLEAIEFNRNERLIKIQRNK